MTQPRLAVVQPNAALCLDREALAKRLETVAASLRDGAYGDVIRVLVVLDAGRTQYLRCGGPVTTLAELVGLLEYAKSDILHGTEPEPL